MNEVQVSYNNCYVAGADSIDTSLVHSTGHAEPTSRLLDGSEDHGYDEEWQEPAILPDGRKCYLMYLFDIADITNADGDALLAEDYPWDDDHVRRIILVD